MTGDEYQKAIDHFNLTQMDSARMFQVNGRTVRRWVADEVPIPHSVAIVLALMRKQKIKPETVVAMFTKKKKKRATVVAQANGPDD